MGIKLTPIITKKQISFEDLENKKIAIDFSNTVFQFLSSIRQRDGTHLMDSKGNVTSHLVGIWSRFTNLMLRNIKLAIVFDGKPPELKSRVKEERAKKKEIAHEKYLQAKEEEDIDLMYKYSKQTTKTTPQIIKESEELLKAMGLPVIHAPSEADAQIGFLAERKDVDFGASSDVDCLIYGTPKLLTNLTLSQRKKLPSGAYVKTTPEVIILKDTLKNLGINNDQLLVIGLLCGTDYNKGIKGIGPKTALKLVKQYKSFDKLFKEIKAPFNWKEIYAVFKSMPVMKNYQLKWKPVDEREIKKILVDEHDFSEERIEKTLKRLRNINQPSLKKFF